MTDTERIELRDAIFDAERDIREWQHTARALRAWFAANHKGGTGVSVWPTRAGNEQSDRRVKRLLAAARTAGVILSPSEEEQRIARGVEGESKP